jgi:hypothetical protein
VTWRARFVAMDFQGIKAVQDQCPAREPPVASAAGMLAL